MHTTPLAEKLRPTTIDQYLGQKHLIGKNSVLRNAIDNGIIPSMILWGGPGIGKTTLAHIIAKQLNRPFYTLSAIHSGVKEVREIIEKASLENDTILFIDEIHRFNKGQQDSLLGAVERGVITLIGATTENPSFEVIPALLSRCQVYILEPHSKEDLQTLIQKIESYYQHEENLNVHFLEHESLLQISGGDARKLINAAELVIGHLRNANPNAITNKMVADIIQQNLVIYDKNGENHYDIISAFIKSIRGSDPNAAVYWLARLIEGGEDPKFIARRMLILASEDIGNANPNALLLANTCFDAINKIGYPECRIILSQTAVYLSTSPKSNSTYCAINDALSLVKQTGNLPVPIHLRNAPTKLMKDIGYGKDYKYAHNYENNFVDLEFLPDFIKGKQIYNPSNNPRENDTRKHLKTLWREKYNY